MSNSLPVVTGFPVVEWDCQKCDAENYADDYGPCQCHWCEDWVVIVPRGIAYVADQKRLKVNGKFEKRNKKPE